MSKQSLTNMLQNFSNLDGVEVRLSMKSGNKMSLRSFSVRGKDVLSEGIVCAKIGDVKHIEIENI